MQTIFHYGLSTEYPPALPIPGKHKEAEDAVDTVDIEQPMAAHEKQAIAALSTLWIIVSEVLFIYRSTESPYANSLAFAQSQYSKVLSWAENLPDYMTRGEHNPAHVVRLQ